MLILLLRVVFVVLAMAIGFTSGDYFYSESLGPWFGVIMGFAFAVTLIAAEQAFRRRFTRSLVAFLVGLAGGLALSCLLLVTLRLTLQRSPDFYNNVDLPLALVTTYLVIITVLRNADRFRVIVPFVEFRAESGPFVGSTAVLDAASLGDARLLGLVRAHLLPGRLLVHREAIAHWERQVVEGQPVEQARARRALDGLAELRALGSPQVLTDETEIPNAPTLHEVLIGLARLEGARLVSADHDLVRRALAAGIQVVDLAALAAALAPQLRPGETIAVLIEKPGEGRGQGIGFLDDGGMVVVADAAGLVGQRVGAVVRRLHTTANGRMVFADLQGGPEIQRPGAP